MTFGYVAMFLIFAIFVFLSVLGYVVEHHSLGDKKLHTSMVEAVEEEHPEATAIETKKEKWALVVHSFSITRNFQEIFFRPYHSVKDKKFEIFNGLRFINMVWLMLGHCYLLASEFGNTNVYLKQQLLNQFFT